MDSERLLDRILIKTASRAGAGFLGPVGEVTAISQGLSADQEVGLEEIETALKELVDRKRLLVSRDHYSLTPISWRRWESLRKDGALNEVQIDRIDPAKFIFFADSEEDEDEVEAEDEAEIETDEEQQAEEA